MLMKLLGNYCRNKDIKTAIRVGVVGEFFVFVGNFKWIIGLLRGAWSFIAYMLVTNKLKIP